MTNYNSAVLYNSSELYQGRQLSDRSTFIARFDDTSGLNLIDFSTELRSIDIRRGRGPNAFDRFDPGQCVVSLVDFNSDYMPTNTLGSMAGKPLAPRRMINIAFDRPPGGDTVGLFSGTVDSVKVDWNVGANVDWVTVQATDVMKQLATASTTVVGGYDLAYERVSAVIADTLPTYFASNALVDTAAGVRVQPQSAARTNALEAIQACATADAGAFFVRPDGYLVFLGRANSWPANDPKVTFTDTGTATDCEYMGLSLVDDETLLYNRAEVTATGGTTQVVESAGSISDYDGPRTLTIGAPLSSDEEALALASFHVTKRAYTYPRIENITFNAYATLPNMLAAESLDLMDVIKVIRTAAGTTFQQNLVIVGVQHRITPDNWVVTHSTHPRF